MAASHSNSFVISSSLAQVNALICDPMFARSTEMTFASHAPAPNQITFRFTTGVTFTSWGEIVQITIAAIAPNQVLMSISSECAMPTQIVDWGKNGDNVTRIINYVNRNIGRYTMAPPAPAAPAQRFCQHCGARLDGGGNFCPKCGQKL